MLDDDLASLAAREGGVPAERIDEALQRQVLGGGTLDTVLLEMGLIDEASVQQLLGRLYRVRAVGKAEIDAVDATTTAVFPRRLAEKHGMVPIEVHGRRLSVAVCGAPDLPLLDEIGFMLSVYVRPVVTTESRIAYALCRLYGTPLSPRMENLLGMLGEDPSDLAEGARASASRRAVISVAHASSTSSPRAPAAAPTLDVPVPPAVPAPPAPSMAERDAPRVEVWQTNGEPERVDTTQLPAPLALAGVDESGWEVVDAGIAVQDDVPHVVPQMPARPAAPLLEGGPAAAEQHAAMWQSADVDSAERAREEQRRKARVLWTVDDAIAELALTGDRDGMLDVLVRFAHRRLTTAGIFIAHRGREQLFLGWDIIDPKLWRNDVRNIALPATGQHVLGQVMSMRSPFLGPMRRDDPLALALERQPRAVVLVPVLVGEHLVAVVYGDCGTRTVPPSSLAELVMVAPRVGKALGNLIVRKKRDSARRQLQQQQQQQAQQPETTTVMETAALVAAAGVATAIEPSAENSDRHSFSIDAVAATAEANIPPIELDIDDLMDASDDVTEVEMDKAPTGVATVDTGLSTEIPTALLLSAEASKPTIASEDVVTAHGAPSSEAVTSTDGAPVVKLVPPEAMAAPPPQLDALIVEATLTPARPFEVPVALRPQAAERLEASAESEVSKIEKMFFAKEAAAEPFVETSRVVTAAREELPEPTSSPPPETSGPALRPSPREVSVPWDMAPLRPPEPPAPLLVEPADVGLVAIDGDGPPAEPLMPPPSLIIERTAVPEPAAPERPGLSVPPPSDDLVLEHVSGAAHPIARSAVASSPARPPLQLEGNHVEMDASNARRGLALQSAEGPALEMQDISQPFDVAPTSEGVDLPDASGKLEFLTTAGTTDVFRRPLASELPPAPPPSPTVEAPAAVSGEEPVVLEGSVVEQLKEQARKDETPLPPELQRDAGFEEEPLAYATNSAKHQRSPELSFEETTAPTVPHAPAFAARMPAPDGPPPAPPPLDPVPAPPPAPAMRASPPDSSSSTVTMASAVLAPPIRQKMTPVAGSPLIRATVGPPADHPHGEPPHAEPPHAEPPHAEPPHAEPAQAPVVAAPIDATPDDRAQDVVTTVMAPTHDLAAPEELQPPSEDSITNGVPARPALTLITSSAAARELPLDQPPPLVSGPAPSPGARARESVLVATWKAWLAHDDDEMEELVGRLHQPGEGGRQAVLAVASHGERAMPALARYFPGVLADHPFGHMEQRPDVGAFSDACAALVRLGPDLAAPILVGELSHDDRLHRYTATWALAELRVPAALPRLTQRIFDAELRIALLALEVLETYRGEPALAKVVSQVRGLLKRGDEMQRRRAILASSELRDRDAVTTLVDLLNTRPKDLAEEARRALIEITKQDFGSSERRWRAWISDNQQAPRMRWLVQGLAHKDLAIRKGAQLELNRLTGHYFGYRFDASRTEREASIQTWNAWLAEQTDFSKWP